MKKLILIIFISISLEGFSQQTEPTVTVKLKVSQWDAVLSVLPELQGKVGNPIASEIVRQATEQLKPPPADSPKVKKPIPKKPKQ